MASTKFFLKGKRNPSPLYFRFTHTREIDLRIRTNILIDPSSWDSKREKIKNIISIKNRDEVNLKLEGFKVYIVQEFNADYIQGEIIDRSWLETKINSFFNRPDGEVGLRIDPAKIYLSDFARKWLLEKADTHKVSANKYMSKATKRHYTRALDVFCEFEGKNKIRLRDLTGDVFDRFSTYLTEKEFSESTIGRMIKRVKFFCALAEEANLEVNKGYTARVFVQKKDDVYYKSPYLNLDEIQKIFDLEINDIELDSVRDNFIIGLWTGLRVSDFLNRLSISNIQNGLISIKTVKTGAWVAIPIHEQVKYVLSKRGGVLPSKCLDQEFNEKIKVICKMAGITQTMVGGLAKIVKDPVTGESTTRKIVGRYKKYELISSHICRRSFATNHFGKVPNKVIMDVCGWASERQMLEYNKQTNIESAKILKEYWDKEMIKLENKQL